MFETLKAYHKWLYDELPYIEDVKYRRRQIDLVPVWLLAHLIYDLLFGWWVEER